MAAGKVGGDRAIVGQRRQYRGAHPELFDFQPQAKEAAPAVERVLVNRAVKEQDARRPLRPFRLRTPERGREADTIEDRERHPSTCPRPRMPRAATGTSPRHSGHRSTSADGFCDRRIHDRELGAVIAVAHDSRSLPDRIAFAIRFSAEGSTMIVTSSAARRWTDERSSPVGGWKSTAPGLARREEGGKRIRLALPGEPKARDAVPDHLAGGGRSCRSTATARPSALAARMKPSADGAKADCGVVAARVADRQPPRTILEQQSRSPVRSASARAGHCGRSARARLPPTSGEAAPGRSFAHPSGKVEAVQRLARRAASSGAGWRRSGRRSR